MNDPRVSGPSRAGHVQMVETNQRQSEISTVTAHPNAVTPGNHLPLTTGQSGNDVAESSGAGAARVYIQSQDKKLLTRFLAEKAIDADTGRPTISPTAALLIGVMLEIEGKDSSIEQKMPFEVIAEGLAPERFALKKFQSSQLQQTLTKFADPGVAPAKAEVEHLIKGHAQAVADQLEHFQLMHNAAKATLGDGGLRDMNTLALSQTSFSEYAGRAAKSIEKGMEDSIALVDSHIQALDERLANPGDASQSTLMEDKHALESARQTLVDLKSAFPESHEAKRLKTIVAHAGLDDQVKELNQQIRTVGGWRGAGPIVAAAIPQFLSSMTHLGYVRSATNDKMQQTVPANSSDASMLRAAVVGLVAGVAHESFTNFLKPVVQSGLQATGLNDRLNMLPLKGIDTNSVIPDPFELKNQKGSLVRKTEQELSADKALVDGERAVLNQKKVQFSSTHPLGEMIPYGAFGGGQAVRQLLNDFNQINGQTVHARALTSGMAGAVSAATQTVAQLNSTYIDPDGRKIPVFTPDRSETKLSKELAKGLDVYNDAGVRTAFYSKAVSGIQSSALTAALPPLATAPAGGGLSAGNVLRNMALAATGSVSYLSTLYANQSVSTEAKALKDAGEGGKSELTSRTETALNNIFHPDRESLPHTFQPGTLGGIPRKLEDAYHIGRGALQLPTQLVVDLARAAEGSVKTGLSSLSNALKPDSLPQTTGAPDDEAMVAMEEGRKP